MTKLKGEKKLTKTLQKWLYKNGFPYEIELGTEFVAYLKGDVIEYALVVDKEQAELFYENAIKWGLKYNVDDFIISLLHEVGHLETKSKLTKKQIKKDLKTRKKIERKEEITKKDNLKYYHLPSERKATKWAIKYINTHPKKIKKFWKKIQPLILEIYNKNNIELDG